MSRLLFILYFLVSNFVAICQQYPYSKLNSSADELNPIVSDDGSYIYFIRRYHPDNQAGMRDPGDIWRSSLDTFNIVDEHIKVPINNKQFNGVIGFLDGGQKVYLYEHYQPGGGPARTQGISVARINESGWSQPGRVEIKYFYNKSEDISIALSEDGNIMLLSLESYGTHGAEDLYVSFRTGTDVWTEPKNLGGVVNTKFQEMTPYLAPDNKTMFFASNGHNGFGGRDIFVTQRQDDSWIKWSSPVNMGPKVNTEGVELYFQYLPGSEYAIYTSTQDSDGYSDFRVIKLPKEELEQLVGDSVTLAPIVSVDITPEIKENVGASGINMHGSLLDIKTNEILNGSIEISNDNWETKIQVSESGYEAEIPEPGIYEIVIKSEQYVSKQEVLDLRATIVSEVMHDFYLQPIVVGATVNLDNVLFVRGSTELIESSEIQLDLVVEMMTENPKMEIELSGHTDNQGNERLNKILSQDRVNEVLDYLSSNGIDKKRLSGTGYGGERPIASNESEETRRFNRRVEFTITKK